MSRKIIHSFYPIGKKKSIDCLNVPIRIKPESVDQLLYKFYQVFKGITITIENSCNPSATAQVNGMEGQITITNAFFYIKHVDIDGLALIIAHEIGHYAGRNLRRKYETTEGEADFFCVYNLRYVWGDSGYQKKIMPAISQLIKYLGIKSKTQVKKRKPVLKAAMDYTIFEIKTDGIIDTL